MISKKKSDSDRCLLNKGPKFGDGQDEADLMSREIAAFFCDEVQSQRSLRGNFYHAELHSVTMHGIFTKMCGATPDGRKVGKPLSDGISPAQGAGREGPTSVAKSAAKMDQGRVCGTLLNQKFSSQILKSSGDLNKLASLVRTYF
jgi:pyruvate-formate lyase